MSRWRSVYHVQVLKRSFVNETRKQKIIKTREDKILRLMKSCGTAEYMKKTFFICF